MKFRIFSFIFFNLNFTGIRQQKQVKVGTFREVTKKDCYVEYLLFTLTAITMKTFLLQYFLERLFVLRFFLFNTTFQTPEAGKSFFQLF
jgi:hypothetical protein